jgi:hypothetical protein
MRSLGLAFLLALALAAPAGAASPGPTILDFEDQPIGARVGFEGSPRTNGGPPVVYGDRTDVAFTDSDNCGRVNEPDGNFGRRYLDDSCGTLRIRFASGQAEVSLFATISAFNSESPPSTIVNLRALDANGQVVDQESPTMTDHVWQPVVLTAPSAAITVVELSVPASTHWVDVDDIGYSSSPQPDTDITSGPSGTVTSRDAAFAFAANQDRVTFTCSLDGGPAERCFSGRSYSGLRDGTHTFTVVATDRWGTADGSPTTRTWTVAADRDADGVLNPADNCPDTANGNQADGDGDKVGDACELLPPGTAPLEAGKATRVRLVSGEVFVKLPAGAAASAFTSSLRVPFQDAGFIPLKGVATVPTGSTLDTRAGQVALTAAVNGQRPRSRSQLRREARFRAGIFQIQQARRSRKQARRKKIPVRAQLVSAVGAEAPCARSAPGGGPLKGVRVRSLSMTAKGVFRAVGGAATVAPAKGTATFVTTDRCDGTVTEVGRGRVAVIAKKTGKKRTVKAGQAYIVRLRLFAARKGRRG